MYLSKFTHVLNFSEVNIREIFDTYLYKKGFIEKKNTIEGSDYSLCNNIDRRNNTCTHARACVRVCMLYSLYFDKISQNLNRFVVVLYSLKHLIFINLFVTFKNIMKFIVGTHRFSIRNESSKTDRKPVGSDDEWNLSAITHDATCLQTFHHMKFYTYVAFWWVVNITDYLILIPVN